MERLNEGIYRVCIPFEKIYTTSFILIENNEAIILDSGSNDEDAKNYIIPAVKKLSVNVKYLVSSHTHGDHHGGIEALKKEYPGATPALFAKKITNSYYLTDEEILLNRFKMLNLKGHSEDSLAVFDIKTKTLLSCDSLQAYGVDRFKTYVCNPDGYLNSLERVKKLNPDEIIASHEYEPLGCIIENDKLEELLKICKDAA